MNSVMIFVRRSFLVIASVMSALGIAGAQQQSGATYTVLPAESLSRSTVAFESPIRWDWRELAIHHFHEFDVLHPDPEMLRKVVRSAQDRGDRAVVFRYVVFPAPEEFRESFYYEFEAERVNEVRPVGLEGVIIYGIASGQVDATGMPVKPPTFSGRLLGESRGEASFVAITNRAISFKAQKVRLDAGENSIGPLLTSTDGEFVFVDETGKKSNLPAETSYGMKPSGARSALFFVPEGGTSPYLLVNWRIEQSPCERIASLYWLANEPQLTKSNRTWRCGE